MLQPDGTLDPAFLETYQKAMKETQGDAQGPWKSGINLSGMPRKMKKKRRVGRLWLVQFRIY